MNEKITDQIRNYFNGQLTAREEFELTNWVKADPKNKAYFLRVKKALEPEAMEHPLLDSSFRELESKLFINGQFKKLTTGRVREIQLSFARIAAIVVLALLCGFTAAYFLQTPHQKDIKVAWFETQVPRGKKSQILLPDGSRVWVNSESKIAYPSNFLEGNREIKLEGEAYFEVAKFQNSPFVVETKDYSIRVLGTKFNVMAYADFDRTETSLIEGKIEINCDNTSFQVNPGESFIFKGNQRLLIKSATSQNARWKDDQFYFDKVTFRELILRMERWYDIDIEVKSTELDDIAYSGVFKNEETIWQVLNIIQTTLPIQYKRVDFRKFIIEKKK